MPAPRLILEGLGPPGGSQGPHSTPPTLVFIELSLWLFLERGWRWRGKACPVQTPRACKCQSYQGHVPGTLRGWWGWVLRMSWALLAPRGWDLDGDLGREPGWPISRQHHPSHPWCWASAWATLKGAQQAWLLLLLLLPRPEAGSPPPPLGLYTSATTGLWPPHPPGLDPSHDSRRGEPTGKGALLTAPLYLQPQGWKGPRELLNSPPHWDRNSFPKGTERGEGRAAWEEAPVQRPVWHL